MICFDIQTIVIKTYGTTNISKEELEALHKELEAHQKKELEAHQNKELEAHQNKELETHQKKELEAQQNKECDAQESRGLGDVYKRQSLSIKSSPPCLLLLKTVCKSNPLLLVCSF